MINISFQIEIVVCLYTIIILLDFNDYPINFLLNIPALRIRSKEKMVLHIKRDDKIKQLQFSFQTMMRSFQIIALLCLVTGVLGITGIGLNPIRPLHLNKGKITKYLFYIDPEVEITSNAQVKITFPSEFNQTALAARLSCLASSPSYTWKKVTCTYSQGSIYIRVWNIKKEQLNILVSSPQNPTIFDMSSSFSLCLMVSSMTMSCSKTFGKVVFPASPTPTNSSAAIVSSLNTLIVGQSSTYQIQFSLTGTYTAGNTVRVTFPPGFLTSSTPICQMKGTYNQVIATFVWPDQRSIECQNINKTLGTGESLKIIGIFNPSYSGVFGNSEDGFKVQILKQTTTIVMEQIYLQSTVTITPGTLTGSISQQNNFILGDVRYTFYLNILNSLTSNNFILIKFPSTWTLYEDECQVVSGIAMSPKTALNCTNSTSGSYAILNVSNFLSASVSNQLVFNTLVRSPATPGTSYVLIETKNIDGTVDTMTTSISINGTYGDYDMLSINAIVAQSDVPVSGTGPLQLTFFLNYKLPQTNVLTSGKFIIKIYPQIPLPPPLVNGVLKCYFLKIYPAKTCIWDTSTSASYTLLTIFTPETIAYQYSQIPITVTTEGAISSSKIGITIADIVTRYRFEVQAFQHNSSSIPTEVYFSQYIAAPIFLPLTYYALTKQVNQYTHLRFDFDSPYNFVSPLRDDLRIKIQFLGGGAWASNLGYTANTIYKRFPCAFSEIRAQRIPPQYNSDVSCDLYTYLDGPHASLTNSAVRGPYILVSGFTNNWLTTSQLRLELGKFLIGSSTNLQAKIRFSLIQQTPTMLTKYVELYYNEFSAFTTSVQNKPTAGSGTVTDSITNPLINTVSQHTFTYTAPSTFFAAIYEFDKISTPSFANAFIQCTTQTVSVANWCTTLGYPANYIIEYSFSSFSTSVSSVLNFTNGVYAGTFVGNVRLLSSAGLTIYKENFNVVYNPYIITVYQFKLDTAYIGGLFKGSQTYFTLRYRPIGATPVNGFIRFIFANGFQLGQKPFCSSSYITPYVAQLGLICTIQSSTSLKITNINNHVGATDYYITVRLASTPSTTSSISPTVTMQTHYSISADPSIVNKVDNVPLSPAQTNQFNLVNTFKLDNPQIAFETPRVGYIGKFQVKINPSNDVLTSYQIKLILNNHAWNTGIWTTPNSVATDPLVCMINYVRVPCTYTLSPLTVTMSVSPAGITSNQENVITLDTEYLVPYNGIKHPSVAGEYNCFIQFLDSGSNIIQQQSFYHRVLPSKLTNIYMESYCTDVGAQNMFYVQFQIGSQNVNTNNDGTTYSRIYVQFPTVDSNNNPLFAKNLGGYTKTGQLVGCAFDTWTNYYVRSVTDRLKCRLIMSEVPGEPARVQIINHNSFSGNWVYMRLWIAKVFNPAVQVTSVPISIKIDHVSVSTNDITELYYDTFDLFMNSQPNSPTVFTTTSCRDVNNTNVFSSEINNRNSFLFYTNALGAFDSSIGFFYAIDMTSALKPRSLEVESSNDCHSSYYYYCLSFPDINYFIIKSKSSNAYRMYLYLQAAGALSQAITNLVAKVWYNQRYRGVHTLQLSTACWSELQGDFTSISISSTANSNNDRYKNKRRSEVQISFRTEYYIPSTGTVLIRFPPSIPRIYPHCRSMNNLGSSLSAQGTSENGEIGCMVQNVRDWVITGFNALNGGSTIIIVGFVDYPSAAGNIGIGQIISFNNTHSSDIRVNGYIIDYWSGEFGLSIVDGPSLNVDGRIILQQTLPLRIGYTGPLSFKFKLPSTLNGPNAGQITVRVPGASTMVSSGGFTYVSASKHVCQIVQIVDFSETGCIITSISVDNSATFPNFMFTMITSDSLSLNNIYKLSITTHTGSQPEGLTFPSVAGTYKVDFNFDTTGSTSFALHDHLYLEVYGTKFAYLQVISMCTIPSKKNLLWIKVTPTTTILTTQQLVIEIPTKGTNGYALFANDLGYTYANGTAYADGDSIPFDMLVGFSQNFMVCRLFYGDQANGKPARIVCGSFQTAITSSQTLFFAIMIMNPGATFLGVQVSIPFFIYSYQQGTTVRTNFDVIENAVLLRTDYDTSASDYIDIQSQNQKQQTPGMFIDMITRNTGTIAKGEYYVIVFNFPIRNNGLVSSGCLYPGGSVYGDAYYHQNLWVIVCSVTNPSYSISAQASGHTTKNLRILNFYTPFYYLASSEYAMQTYSYYFNSKKTSIGYVYDGYPNESPKQSGDPTFSLTAIHQSPKYTGSRDDYTITFTFSASATVDISFTKLIAVIFPSSVDFAFYQSDCVQSPSSQVQIASCYIDTATANRIIWITPVVKSSYLSNMAVSITTRNLAVRNPTTNSFDINSFTVKYYTWQNITQPSLSPRSNNNYCFLIINNLPSSTVSFSYNPNPYAVDTFKYIHFPHQRYYQQTPFSNLVHRAPFQMEFYTPVVFNTQTGTNYNMIKVVYGSAFGDASSVKIRDLQVFRPVCYLNNQRVKLCTIDTSLKQITMSFLFPLAVNTRYHLKFSILDSRNADINGFLPTNAVSSIVLMVKPNQAGSVWSYTETDQFPTLYSLPSSALAGPFRGIIAGAPTYGHTIAGQLNFVNLLLTFNRTDITGLVFEIVPKDKAGTNLFANQGDLTTTFMSQSDGGSYPCGNNGLSAGGSVRCILLKGQFSNSITAGTPTRIVMTGFTYATQMNCRFLFVNPPTVGSYFSVTVRAFGGTATSLNPYGNQYMGFWQFNEIFQVASATVDSNSRTATSYKCPSQSPWRNNTSVYVFSRSQTILNQRSAIAEVKIYDSSLSTADDNFCQAELYSPAANQDDLLQYTLVSGSTTVKYAYFVTTFQGNTNVAYTTPSGGWALSYLKCKYFALFSIRALFFFSDVSVEIATNNFGGSDCDGNTPGINQPISKYFSQNYFINDGTDTNFVHQIDITPAYTKITNFNFRNGDSMVLAITYGYSYWGTIKSCNVLGGIISSSINKVATCSVSSSATTTEVYITNIGGFFANPLLATTTNYRVKILFVGDLISTSFSAFNFNLNLYSNSDGYTSGYQSIINHYNSLSAVTPACYYSSPGTCTYGQGSSALGTMQVLSLSDTFMSVAFSPQSSTNFAASTNFIHDFVITFNGFNFGPTCTINSVIFEYSTSMTPGQGTNNTFPINSAVCGQNTIELIFQGRAFADYWGGVAAAGNAKNGWYNSGQYIIFYITISPSPSARDLPSLQHQYLFIQGSYNYRTTGGWTSLVQKSYTMPSQPLANSVTFSTISNNVNAVTQLSFQITSLNVNIGPQNTGYSLLVEFIGTSGWTTTNDPFATYTNTAITNDNIACKCYAGTSPLTVSVSSPLVDANCIRRLPSGSFNNYAILVNYNALKNQDLICFFPQFKVTSSMTFTAQFKLVYGDSYPPQLVAGSTKYSSMYRVQSTLTISTQAMPSPSFTVTQTPDIYAAVKTVGSTFTGSYSLAGAWGGNLNSPFIYINFLSSGPIPIYSFCSDSNIFLQCRVYVNYVYVIVARLKSTSVNNFNLINGANSLLYPPSKTSLSNYGLNVYVGTGTWQYSGTKSRDSNYLSPFTSSSLLNIYSDKYGSNKASYNTLLFFSFNLNGQYLYNNILTGSKLVLSWPTLTTTTNCQVWVQNEPLVNLQCTAGANILTITSPFYDYSTANNIIISVGLTNPTSATTTFTAILYSYYFASTYSTTISTSNTYTTDVTYTSSTKLAKGIVEMYPFQSRISTVANAPLRIRFQIPSGSIGRANGRLDLAYSQIQYSGAHYCYIIKYNDYTSMMQQTQRTVYRTTCTSSLSVIYVTPPSTLTLVSSVYYQLVMLPLGMNSCSQGCVTQSGYHQTNFDQINLIAYSNINSGPSIIAQQVHKLYAYEGSYYIGLQQIYILCTEPRITSLYISININFTSSYNFPSHYLEITLYELGITQFPLFTVGSIFPCQLSSNFLAINNRQLPQCRVVSADLLNSFVTIRIENIGFLTPQIYWISLDDIQLPSPGQSDNNKKFDIAIAYYGPSNTKYFNYFPEIFQIDASSNTPTINSGYTFNNPSLTGYGNQIVGQVSFSWPFDSSTHGYESKVALNINGGYSSTWANIDSVTFVDATGTYQILWVNKKLNKFVFAIPNKGNAISTILNITSLNNPYPYQRQLYELNGTNMIINFYNKFFLSNSRTFGQPAWGIFTRNPSLIYINQNLPSNTIDNYPSTNTFAPNSLNTLRLSITFDETPANILARNLGNIMIKFTSGISYIRECRAMRNNTQYVNTEQVCQAYYDGTNWQVKIYRFANSDLTTGWYVQILANFNSATLIYTSYAMASNNLQIEYQSTYTVALSAYNPARSTLTKLSWMNNKYINYFHETQVKFLEAVSGQSTQYLKFRFTAPIDSSTANDIFYIYLPDDQSQQPFTPKNSGANLIGQYLPAVGDLDRDFSIGSFSQCTMATQSSYYYYKCEMRYGGLKAGYDYLFQLSEYNTATSSFYMPVSPGRREVRFFYHYYPLGSNYQYYDSVHIRHYSFFRFAEFLHTTTTINDYKTIKINYRPNGDIGPFDATQQVALRLSVDARYHAFDGGITDIYTADSKTLLSGSRFSGVVSNPDTGYPQINTIQFSTPIENAPLRFVLAKQKAYTNNNLYYWIVPLIKNPGVAYISLRYNLTLVVSPAGSQQYIFNHYESINQYYTVADTSTSFTTSIANNLRSVQTVNAVDLSVNMATYSLAQWNTAIFKLNNALPGLIQNIASPNDTTNYDYYYFNIINMIMAQKKSTNSITTIGIGSSSSAINYQSTFGISWVKVFNNLNAPQATNPYTLLYSTPPTLTLAYLTSYAASSITLIQGLQTQGSAAMYKVTFTTPILPAGGEIRILFDNNYFTSLSGGSCRPNTNIAKSSSQNDILRCYRVSEGLILSGFAAKTSGSSIAAYIMLKSKAAASSSPIKVDLFGIYQDNTTRISLSNVGTITHTAGTAPQTLYRYAQTVNPYFLSLHSTRYRTFEGVFNLKTQAISNSGNSGQIQFTEPAYLGLNAGGTRRLLIKQNVSSITGWTQCPLTYSSSPYYRYIIPTDNIIAQPQTVAINIDYIFRYTVYFSSTTSTDVNGFYDNSGGANRVVSSRIWIKTYFNSIWYDVGYYDFVYYPEPFALAIKNRYTAANRQTVLDLSWTNNIDISASSKIVITFDTHNLLYTMFADDVEGAGTNGATYRYLDCRQWLGYNEISGSRIICILNFGNSGNNPPTPANLTIKFTTISYGWSSSNTIRLLVANVKNPSTVGMNVGLTVNAFIPCSTQQNQQCSGNSARGYYVTSASTQNLQSTAATFSSSSSLVLATSQTHTFTLSLTASITTDHAIYIVYPENFQGVMPNDCTSSGYNCFVFPLRRWVVLYPTGTIGSGSRTINISPMNNPYYAQAASPNFLVTVARSFNGIAGDTYQIPQTAFTPVSYSFQNIGQATSLSVQTTQTPSMYLRNYANTVIFTISKVFSDSRARAIYIKAPTDVTSWDPTYCNASITTTQNFAYPLRFTCTVDPNAAQFLRLTLDSDMPTFTNAWGLLNIRLHAKFTLGDFSPAPTLYVTGAQTSGSFFAYSSVSATSSSSIYYMSQSSTTVSISANQVPIISVINFNTQSFADREARVNNKEVFYMLFKPLVNVNFGSIVFTIPSEFNYPGVFQFDNCLMIGRTTIQQPDCQLSRSQGQTLVTMKPTGYDNNVKILQIGTVSQTNWFTAPSLPGNFYKMNVAAYSSTGALISKQTRHISPVYGASLDIPSMSIKNIQDNNIKLSVYDLTFVTGTLQIPPGAPTTATTQTSQLQFIFENYNGMNQTNVFDNDLKTGLTSGQEVGCKIFSGLAALPGLRIKCLLYVGTNSTDKPKIRIINYNFINPGTSITVGFAGIQSLPSTLVNTISIGAIIYYTDIDSWTYLYIPTPIVTIPTNATSMFSSMPAGWISGWSVSAGYSGTNIVLQPTVFSVTFTCPYWYWQNQFGNNLYNYQYASTGADHQFILLTFYPPTLLDKNNPLLVNCTDSGCTGVDVYYASGTVRFRHNTATTSQVRTFQFNNFPTSAYSMLNKPVYVYFQIFQYYQAVYQKNITINLNRTVEKCTKFSFGVVSVSSLNGGEIGVTYLFSIQTNHFVPANGAITITIPSVYGNMIDNLATCTLKGFDNTNCYCMIKTPYRIDIYMNGTQLLTGTTYSIQVTGLQNPNIASSNFNFIVTSYYESNIYLALKICENQIIPPSINVKPLRTCKLSWTPQYYNQNFNTTYAFQLSCSDVFRGDSILYINLPTAFSTTNSLGTVPCSSYQSTTLLQPVCNIQSIDGVFTITTSIDASSQSSLSLILNLVNPINNTYSANAYVTSKGTQYASSGNSSLTILSNSYAQALSTHVELLNLPKQAGLMATYVFKIAPMSTFVPTNLGISFPSNFNIDSASVSVAIFNNAKNNIFSLLTYNNIQGLINNVTSIAEARVSSYPSFSVDGTSIYLKSIGSQVSSSLWTYVFVSNIQNPSAYIYANFTVAYYLISSGFQSLQWVYQFPLTYYISSPPGYLSITSVSVSDYDLLYPAKYTFQFSTNNGGYIGIAGKALSYVIVIPTFYKSTLWANNAPICKFNEKATASDCKIYQGQIIVNEQFSTNLASLTLTISFLLNPSLPTYCNTTDTTVLSATFFKIRIIDTLSNTFVFESSSVVDGSNCLAFSAVRIPISVQYSLIMTAGLAYNITYGLTKPSANLKITSYVDNSGFTFSPATVDFNNFYDLTKNTQLFLRSDVSPGTYVIYFNKSQSTNQTSFRNILPVTITVVASSASLVSAPTIRIPSMSDSTVGYPVKIPVIFSLPSSTQMTLFMSILEQSNQTLVQYYPSFANFSLKPDIINIQPQVTEYEYTLTYKSRVVPPPLTLNFKLTSNYPIVHNLDTPLMYLCFDRDPKYNVLYPPLRVTVTQFLTSCNLQDVGKIVTNIFVSSERSESSATFVTPKIISLSVESVASTGAIVKINSISPGTIYFACIPIGYPNVTNVSDLAGMNITNSVSGSTTSQALTVSSGNTAQINYVASATISNLNQSSNYIFYAISQNNLGTSQIKNINFTTTLLSKSVKFTICLTEIVDKLNIVSALVETLRVKPMRFRVLTSPYDLNQIANSVTSFNNKPKYNYDIVLAPDSGNDIVPPLTSIKTFAENSTYLSNFKKIIPSFDISTKITYFQLRPSVPQIKSLPTPVKITHNEAQFKIQFKAQTDISVIIMEKIGAARESLTGMSVSQAIKVKDLPPNKKAIAPFSSQIKSGKDFSNNELGKYKVLNVLSDQRGFSTLAFRDLKQKSSYTMYITASSPSIMGNDMLWPDQDVLVIQFFTLPNPNVGTQDRQKTLITQFAILNPKLGEQMLKFIQMNQKKQQTKNN